MFRALRYHLVIGDEVVHEISTGRARITQIAHLHGRGAVRKDSKAHALCKAHQVHCDVDAAAAQQRGEFLIGHLGSLDDLIAGGAHVPTLRTVLRRRQGDAHHFDAGPIVALEHGGHQVRYGVLAKIGGQVGHPQRPRPARCRISRRPFGSSKPPILPGNVTARARELQFRRVQQQARQRIDDPALAPQVLLQACRKFGVPVPAASVHLHVKQIARGFRVPR